MLGPKSISAVKSVLHMYSGYFIKRLFDMEIITWPEEPCRLAIIFLMIIHCLRARVFFLKDLSL